MSRSIAVLMFGLVCLAAGPASALSYTSWRWSFENGGYVAVGDPLSYTHAFTPPETDILLVENVTLGIAVVDDRDRAQEWVEITLEAGDAESLFATGSATANIFYGDVTATAEIEAWGDELLVNVYSTGGDFRVVTSRAEFTYQTGDSAAFRSGGGSWGGWGSGHVHDRYCGHGGGGGNGPTVPEPTAAMVFGLGSLLIAAAVQRRTA
jgi:hypothetical protein